MIQDSSWEELAGDRCYSHCLSLPCQTLHRAATNWGWLGEPGKKRPLYHVMHPTLHHSASLCNPLCSTLYSSSPLLATMFSSAIFDTALNFSVLLLGIHLMQLIVCWCVYVEKCVCHRTSNHSPCILDERVLLFLGLFTKQCLESHIQTFSVTNSL